MRWMMMLLMMMMMMKLLLLLLLLKLLLRWMMRRMMLAHMRARVSHEIAGVSEHGGGSLGRRAGPPRELLDLLQIHHLY